MNQDFFDSWNPPRTKNRCGQTWSLVAVENYHFLTKTYGISDFDIFWSISGVSKFDWYVPTMSSMPDMLPLLLIPFRSIKLAGKATVCGLPSWRPNMRPLNSPSTVILCDGLKAMTPSILGVKIQLLWCSPGVRRFDPSPYFAYPPNHNFGWWNNHFCSLKTAFFWAIPMAKRHVQGAVSCCLQQRSGAEQTELEAILQLSWRGKVLKLYHLVI